MRISILRYTGMFVALSVLVALGRYFDINHATVALLFLIAVLFVSAYWGLRFAVVLSFIATAAFNFFFLPPLYTFTIAEPQNWIALLAFLVTALVAGNLSEKARREAEEARLRRQEVERLYALSQRLLTSENLVSLMNQLPKILVETFRFRRPRCMLPTVRRRTAQVRKRCLTKTSCARWRPGAISSCRMKS